MLFKPVAIVAPEPGFDGGKVRLKKKYARIIFLSKPVMRQNSLAKQHKIFEFFGAKTKKAARLAALK